MSSRRLQVGVTAGLEPRLLTAAGVPESLAEYVGRGGYRDLPDGAELIDTVEAAGLRGRGGAAFPTARKLRAVRAGRSTPVVVANGEEGEPTSVKDRWLLRNRPHLVLDGVLHAATAVGSDLAYVYVSDEVAEASVLRALTALGGTPVEIRIVRVRAAYVAGEETAAVRFLNGGPAKPTEKPPRPFEEGVAGRPTLVSNVETLANLPVLSRMGAAAYRAVGTERSPGTFLLTLGGAVAAPGLYEVPFGISLGSTIEALGGALGTPVGALLGGYFGGLLNERIMDLPLEYDTLFAAGSGLGCGAITVLGPDDCPVDVAEQVLGYFARENAAQCGSCFNGTAAMSAVVSGLRAQVAVAHDVDRLERWSVTLKGRGACSTLDGAAQLAASLLREYPQAVRAHLDADSCAPCAVPREGTVMSPFAVDVPTPQDEFAGSAT